MQALAPYPQAVVDVTAAFLAANLRVERDTETEACFIAKCEQAGCLDAARQADVSWALRRPGIAGAMYYPAQLTNFFSDLRIYRAFGLLPR